MGDRKQPNLPPSESKDPAVRRQVKPAPPPAPPPKRDGDLAAKLRDQANTLKRAFIFGASDKRPAEMFYGLLSDSINVMREAAETLERVQAEPSAPAWACSNCGQRFPTGRNCTVCGPGPVTKVPPVATVSDGARERLLGQMRAWFREHESALRASLAALLEPTTAPPDAEQAHAYLSRLLTHCAPQCEPLPDLMGVCTQIDNLLTGFRLQSPPPDAGVSRALLKAAKWAMRHLRGHVSFGASGDAFDRVSGRELVGFVPKWNEAEKAIVAAERAAMQPPPDAGAVIQELIDHLEDDMPPDIRNLIDRCEASVRRFSNDDMSAALHAYEQLRLRTLKALAALHPPTKER